MSRIKIKLEENGQGLEVELDDLDVPIDELGVKALKIVGGLGDWIDGVKTNQQPAR